ncbi:DUF59 domain-containing protein [Rhodococcus sp. WS4]|nr:DUF59 domain-containing protein [Rhodococcus sp. WS4]
MVTVTSLTESVRRVVETVEDPELPVTIGDLGMVRDVRVEGEGDRVVIRLRPTFLGCPARFLIEATVKSSVAELGSVTEVKVEWESGAEWRPEDVSPAGQAKLKDHGVLVDLTGVEARCPYCDATGLELVSERGVALCRRLAFCPTCRSSVDVMGPARGPACSSPAGTERSWLEFGR